LRVTPEEVGRRGGETERLLDSKRFVVARVHLLGDLERVHPRLVTRDLSFQIDELIGRDLEVQSSIPGSDGGC